MTYAEFTAGMTREKRDYAQNLQSQRDSAIARSEAFDIEKAALVTAHTAALFAKDTEKADLVTAHAVALTAEDVEASKAAHEASMQLGTMLAAKDAEIAKLTAVLETVVTLPEGETLLKARRIADAEVKIVAAEAAKLAAEKEKADLEKAEPVK